MGMKLGVSRRLRVSENRVLRVCGHKREEDGSWRKLQNNGLHGLYSSPNIVRVIKSRRMRWEGHVPCMEGRSIYRVLVGRPESKRPLGRPRCRWEDNIKINLRETRIDGANWICLSQDRVCEHGNEPLDSIKEIGYSLTEYQLFKDYHAPRSE
jgi:hypothetical protein